MTPRIEGWELPDVPFGVHLTIVILVITISYWLGVWVACKGRDRLRSALYDAITMYRRRLGYTIADIRDVPDDEPERVCEREKSDAAD